MKKTTLMISKAHGVVKEASDEANIHHCFEVILFGDLIFYTMGDNENFNTKMMSSQFESYLGHFTSLHFYQMGLKAWNIKDKDSY